MAQYRFHEGTVPAGYRQGYEPSLFNVDAHRHLQSPEGWCSFLIVDDAGGVVCGAMHVHVQGSLAQSPLRSPFGSIEFSADLPGEILKAFIEFVEQVLMAKGVTKLKIKNYPEAYAPYRAQLLKSCLFDLTYALLFNETSSVIGITGLPPQASFHRSEKRRLRKCLKGGMEFRQLTLDQLEYVYNFIRLCREEKQYKLSMTYASLEHHVKHFPSHYFLFGVFQDSILVAASITVRAREKILYDFYHDHARAFNQFSPAVLLVAGIYEFCYQQNIRLLDLGTSETDRGPNLSLLRFKRNLGAKPTPKLTFEKILSA